MVYGLPSWSLLIIKHTECDRVVGNVCIRGFMHKGSKENKRKCFNANIFPVFKLKALSVVNQAIVALQT